MKYLIDSNVLLEAALQRQHWRQAAEFLAKCAPADLAIADFSLHALGFYLVRRTPEVFDSIITDVLSRGIAVLRIDPAQLQVVTTCAKQHGLDFDDAFVYTVAEFHNLVIVSFDADFDRTPRRRSTPGAILAQPS